MYQSNCYVFLENTLQYGNSCKLKEEMYRKNSMQAKFPVQSVIVCRLTWH